MVCRHDTFLRRKYNKCRHRLQSQLPASIQPVATILLEFFWLSLDEYAREFCSEHGRLISSLSTSDANDHVSVSAHVSHGFCQVQLQVTSATCAVLCLEHRLPKCDSHSLFCEDCLSGYLCGLSHGAVSENRCRELARQFARRCWSS